MSVINQMLKDLDSRRGQPGGTPLAGLLPWGVDREMAPSGIQTTRWVLLLAAAAGIGALIWQSGRQQGEFAPLASTAPQPLVTEKPSAAPPVPAGDPAPVTRSRIQEIAWERAEDGALELIVTLDRMPGTAITRERHDNSEIEYIFPATRLDAGLPMLDEDNRYYSRYRLARRGEDVHLTLTPKEGVTVSAGATGDSADGATLWAVRAQLPPAPQARPAAAAKTAPAKAPASQTRTEVVRAKPETSSPPPADPVKTPVDPARIAEQSYRRALDYLRVDRVPPAVAELNKALSARPAFHVARELLASLYLRTGREAEAHLLLREGMTLDRSHLSFPKLSARALIERGRLEEALELLAAGAPHAGADAEYQALYAAVAQRLSEHETAAGRYMQALELESERGAWWLGLAISLEALDRDREAAEAYAAAGRSGQLGAEVAAYARERLQALGGGR